jgi:hypothetical protein
LVKFKVHAGLGKPNILITGKAGVEKSVLAGHYHGEANSLDWNEPGTSVVVEIKPITVGDWTKIVSVVPGQNTRNRTVGLDTTLNSHDRLERIIDVVDWEYTAIRDLAHHCQGHGLYVCYHHSHCRPKIKDYGTSLAWTVIDSFRA